MKHTAEFLLEIGCEEIPARMIPRAAAEFKVILEKHFSSERILGDCEIQTFGAPRRLVAICQALPLRQPDIVREVSGPPKAVAYDDVGRPTKAAGSFAARHGLQISKLYVVTTPKGEYLAGKQTIRGRPTREILRELLPRAIAAIPWPRSMYWRSPEERFVRPVRWIVALLGGQAIPLRFAGVTSGKTTAGHRFLGKRKIPIGSLAEYFRKLRTNYVLADPAERRKKIERELQALTRKNGLQPHRDEELLELVTYLNEFPTVIRGEFDPSFLQLPEEILITVMRDHQKYFAVEHKDGGLAPHFLAVINLDRDRAGVVGAGHERVLRARFTDAQFFWDVDQKCRLADNLPKLATVTFESRLGSYADKTQRLRDLTAGFVKQWSSKGVAEISAATAIRAAELAKCDLVTEMVREFPELQGIVGGLYARVQGEPEEIAWAIYDQYRPAGLEDPIPRNLAGCAVSLADKLDTLVGCFAIGIIPSGSSDPFALRRAALGIVKVLVEKRLPFPLAENVHAVAQALEKHPPKIKVTAEVQKAATEFILERARFVFRERYGFAYDEVNAVMAAGSDDLVDALNRLEALRAIRRSKNFEPLAASFKRIRNILEKAGPAEHWRLPAVQPGLFVVEAERTLHIAASQVARETEQLRREYRYREALSLIAGLRPLVDKFFADVLVMAEEENLRRNRLTLLSELLREFSTIADFSELAVTKN